MYECALAVFRELGLLEAHSVYAAGEETRWVRLSNSAGKVELTESVRYREGMGERAVFAVYRDLVLSEPLSAFQERVTRPILPPCASAECAFANGGDARAAGARISVE